MSGLGHTLHYENLIVPCLIGSGPVFGIEINPLEMMKHQHTNYIHNYIYIHVVIFISLISYP